MKENKIHRMFGHPLLYVSILSLPGGCVFGTHAGAGKKVDPAAGPKTETKTKKAPPTKKKAATTKPVVGTAGAGTGLGGGGSTPAPTVPPSTGSSSSNSANQNSSPGPIQPIRTPGEAKNQLIAAAGNVTNEERHAIVTAVLTYMKDLWYGLDTEKKVDANGKRISDEAFNDGVKSFLSDSQKFAQNKNNGELQNLVKKLSSWLDLLTPSSAGVSSESENKKENKAKKGKDKNTNGGGEDANPKRITSLCGAVRDLIDYATRLDLSADDKFAISARATKFLSRLDKAQNSQANVATYEAILKDAQAWQKTLPKPKKEETDDDTFEIDFDAMQSSKGYLGE